MTKSKLNYREQNGCHNCKHCDIDRPLDEVLVYFCQQDGTREPNAGAQRPFRPGWEQYGERRRTWQKEHEVEAFGVCDCWEREKDETR